MSYSKSIFINCPFDAKYKRLLHPLLFVCIYIGLEPKLSNLNDSGSIRILNILKLIKGCKYSIHDLCRMKSSKANQLARFNMPFELGLDLGVRSNARDKLKTKKCLVIDEEKYRYHSALSDLSGSDIASYGKKNQPEKLIKIIRDWLTNVLHPEQPPASMIYLEYTEFVSDLQIQLENVGFTKTDISNLSNAEYIHYCSKWVENRI
jgi:hypothetical protein